MCLSIPAKILKIEGDRANAIIGNNMIEIGLHLVDDVKVNDYVLVHTGYALQKISEEEALEAIRIINELNEDNIEF